MLGGNAYPLFYSFIINGIFYITHYLIIVESKKFNKQGKTI